MSTQATIASRNPAARLCAVVDASKRKHAAQTNAVSGLKHAHFLAVPDQGRAKRHQAARQQRRAQPLSLCTSNRMPNTVSTPSRPPSRRNATSLSCRPTGFSSSRQKCSNR